MKIFINPKNNIKFTNQKYDLYRIKLKKLGFTKATKLKKIYSKLKKEGFLFVPPDVALRTRLKYKDQKTGEWLRFATPFHSMIDDDGVLHLPKLEKLWGNYLLKLIGLILRQFSILIMNLLYQKK